MMEATVTMSLAAYKELERDLLEAEQKVNRANEAVKSVYNLNLDEVLDQAEKLRESRNRMNIREAVYKGQL